MKKCFWTKTLSIYSFITFLLAVATSAGGHGWGEHIISFFYPFVYPAAMLDATLRCAHTSTCPPSFWGYEIPMLLVATAMFTLEFAAIGVLIDWLRARKRQEKLT